MSKSQSRKNSTAVWYWRIVWAMLRLKPLTGDKPRHVAKEVRGWNDDALKSLIEESRRELDDQKSSLDRTLSRSQLLFTTHLGLIAFYGTVAGSVWKDTSNICAWWVQMGFVAAAGVLLVFALLGSAALIAVRKPFDRVSAVVMSKWESFDLERLANDYAAALATGDMTNNAHLSVFGSVVRMTVFAALLAALGWLVAQVL